MLNPQCLLCLVQSIVVKCEHAQLRWTSTKHRRGRISVDNRIHKPLGHMAPSSPSPSSRVSSNIDLRQLELPGRGREESTHILVITQRSGKHCQMKSINNAITFLPKLSYIYNKTYRLNYLLNCI